MSITEIIMHYLPFWLLGIAMVVATLFSEHKDLMVIKPRSLGKFLKIMAFIMVVRSAKMFLFPPSAASMAPIMQLPLWLTATVGWEDAVHTLPLALMARFLGNKLPARIIVGILTAVVMLSFGLGHTYQGTLAACMISLYIPYVTKLGKEHGFGTVMVCHCIYDFVTLLTVRLFVGL